MNMQLSMASDWPQVSWLRNGNLGRFTNFVNLQDMCGIAVPSGILHGERPLKREKSVMSPTASTFLRP